MFHLDNTFEEIGNKIHCLVSKLEPRRDFKPFFFLDDYIVYDFNDYSLANESDLDLLNSSNSHVSYISKIATECRRQGLNTKVVPSQKTKIRHLKNLVFNKIFIYRDLPRCDHMILFTNLYTDPSLKSILAFETRVNSVIESMIKSQNDHTVH